MKLEVGIKLRTVSLQVFDFEQSLITWELFGLMDTLQRDLQ